MYINKWYSLKDYYMNKSKIIRRDDDMELYYFIHENCDEVLELLQCIVNVKYEKHREEMKENDCFEIMLNARGY